MTKHIKPFESLSFEDKKYFVMNNLLVTEEAIDHVISLLEALKSKGLLKVYCLKSLALELLVSESKHMELEEWYYNFMGKQNLEDTYDKFEKFLYKE